MGIHIQVTYEGSMLKERPGRKERGWGRSKETKSNFNPKPAGALECRLHSWVCAILRHGSWGLNLCSRHPSATQVWRDVSLTHLQERLSNHPGASFRESWRDEPLAPMLAGRWIHQIDKRNLRISEPCTNSICYRKEALFLRVMCQTGPKAYLIQASQSPCMTDSTVLQINVRFLVFKLSTPCHTLINVAVCYTIFLIHSTSPFTTVTSRACFVS